MPGSDRLLAALLFAACAPEEDPAPTVEAEERPLAPMSTTGSVSCDDGEALPLYAASFGVSGGAVAVALEIVPSSGERLVHDLEETWYYEWEGRFPLDFATDCANAASATFFMRWTRWDGEPDLVEELALE
jgi:hypothetical protein